MLFDHCVSRGRLGEPSLPRFALIAAMLFLLLHTSRAAPPAIWSGKVTDPAAIDAAWKEVPAPLRPAVEFQKILLKIRNDAPVTEWRAEMEKAANVTGEDGVSIGLRELARCWLARAQMIEMDRALRKYYASEVRFPDALSSIAKEIPAPGPQDPWGEAWAYQPTAPKGFSQKFAKQRYQLGPARYPQLSPLENARKFETSPKDWKVMVREAGGARALELRSADGKTAVVQPGGRFLDATLMFVGDGWALLADTERIFTLTF
jgi:hypothetical protein